MSHEHLPPTRPTALVTGAAGGIGRAIVDALASGGFDVVAAVHRSAPDLDRPGVTSLVMDVADPESVRAAAKTVAARVGDAGLRAVVNNAGIIVTGPLELTPAADLERQFAVNTLGPLHVTREFLPLLRAGRGRLVNISAPSARIAFPFMAALSASKAALSQASAALRGELAPWSIPVVVVEPGASRTAIWDKAGAWARAADAIAGPGLAGLYAAQVEAVARANEKQRFDPVEPVGAAVLRAVTARRPRRLYAVGGARAAGLLAHLPAPTREAAVRRVLGQPAAGSALA